MTQTCLIVGASHAAAQLATSLRQGGWDGPIRMIGDEARLPYHRPPLSKAFLAGEKDADGLAIRPAAFYEKHGIEFVAGSVTAIDRKAKTLTLADGSQQSYDKLALCTGARVRQLSIPGAELAGVHYLRTLADVEGIKQQLGTVRKAVIIGGGYIGLETAASLRKQGVDVTVLEMAERILQRVTAAEVSAFYHRIHQEEGVAIHTGVAVTALEGEPQVEQVLCADGQRFPADLVIVGVGVLPNTELAEAAWLDVENGVVINEYCQTSDPDIVAAGDCANHFDAHYDCRLRLESVPNANEQAKSAAATLCGQRKPYQTVPWFWSDQYDLKLQIAGLSHGYDQVIIRGDEKIGRSFTAFYLRDGELISADCVNRPQEFMLVRKKLGERARFDPAVLRDESIPTKQLLTGTAITA